MKSKLQILIEAADNVHAVLRDLRVLDGDADLAETIAALRNAQALLIDARKTESQKPENQ